MGAVVVHEGRVLLVRRPESDFMGGIFELPSGKVDPGEALDAALVRDVAEETGLTGEHLDTYLGAFDYTSGSGRPTRQFTFAVTVITPGPVALTVHDEYRWHSLDEEPPVTDAVRHLLDVFRHAAR